MMIRRWKTFRFEGGKRFEEMIRRRRSSGGRHNFDVITKTFEACRLPGILFEVCYKSLVVFEDAVLYRLDERHPSFVPFENRLHFVEHVRGRWDRLR